jgi:hypothetical protein
VRPRWTNAGHRTVPQSWSTRESVPRRSRQRQHGRGDDRQAGAGTRSICDGSTIDAVSSRANLHTTRLTSAEGHKPPSAASVVAHITWRRQWRARWCVPKRAPRGAQRGAATSARARGRFVSKRDRRHATVAIVAPRVLHAPVPRVLQRTLSPPARVRKPGRLWPFASVRVGRHSAFQSVPRTLRAQRGRKGAWRTS